MPAVCIGTGLPVETAKRPRTAPSEDDGPAALSVPRMQLAEVARRGIPEREPRRPSRGPAYRARRDAGLLERRRSARPRIEHAAASDAPAIAGPDCRARHTWSPG